MRRPLLAAALALCASVAEADNGIFYFGAGVTANHVDSVGVEGFDNNFPAINSTSWQVFAGIRPIRPFAVEVDYADLGRQANVFQTPISCGMSVGSCSVSWDEDAKALAVYALGFMPLQVPTLEVYGKAGLARYKLSRSVTSYGIDGATLSYSAYPDDSTVFTWGGGVQVHFGIIGGRLEYEGFNKAGSGVYSLSVFLTL
jgi:hypothetical protein